MFSILLRLGVFLGKHILWAVNPLLLLFAVGWKKFLAFVGIIFAMDMVRRLFLIGLGTAAYHYIDRFVPEVTQYLLNFISPNSLEWQLPSLGIWIIGQLRIFDIIGIFISTLGVAIAARMYLKALGLK